MIHLGEDYQGRFHMEIYICYIYIFFANLTKVQQTQLVRKEKTCKRVQVPLYPAT